MVIVVNLVRAAVLVVLVATIVGGTVNIAVVLDHPVRPRHGRDVRRLGSSTFLPSLVRREDLGLANARMQGAFLLTNQLVAPPIGAFLFAVGMALPFATNAVCFVLGRAARLAGRSEHDGPSDASGPACGREMAEGIRWLLAHPPMRTLALTIFTFNVTFGAAWSVLVLYANERLGHGRGGVRPPHDRGRRRRHRRDRCRMAGWSGGSRSADIMRAGLLIETLTHLVAGHHDSSAVALATLVVFGAHAFVWGTTSEVVRQRAVPDELLGRVTGVYRVAIIGGLVIGTPIGGLLARAYGITAPFWFGFIGSALLVAVLWRQFDNIVHAGDVSPG